MNILVRQVTEIKEDCLTVTPCFLLSNGGLPFTTMAHLSVNSKQGNALAKKYQIIQFSLLIILNETADKQALDKLISTNDCKISQWYATIGHIYTF